MVAKSRAEGSQAQAESGAIPSAGSSGYGKAHRKFRKGGGSWSWAAPAIILVAGFVYASNIAGAGYAFTDWNGLSSPTVTGLQNFRTAFRDPVVRQALEHTFEIAFAFVILTNVIGLLFALALNRTLKTRSLLRVLVFVPVVLSPLAVSYVWEFIFQPTGPLNSILTAIGLHSLNRVWLGEPALALWSIIVVMVWQNIGLVMVIYLGGLAGVRPELEEAAAVDGAGPWRRFRSIIFHEIQPSVLMGSVLMMILGLKVFDQVVALTGGGPFNATQTLATLVYQESFVNGQFGYGDALSLILTIAVVLVALAQVLLFRLGDSAS